ncbi:MAG TPA: GHMP kinase [Spirochaetia bacterium]|nr:GHMP kinase [Spirochaetia bacterium]
MIITKTPFRISFVGGGSDLEDYYSRESGAVLSTSIDKYMYIASHKFFDTEKIRIKYSQTETVTNINEIRHPIVYEVLKRFKIHGALEISSNADMPAGSGLGSSSAFTVGLLHNLHARQGRYITKEQLAEEACIIEIQKLKEPIGKQDQYASAFGGLNVFTFNKEGTVSVEPVHLRREVFSKFRKTLLMFYIGNVRKTSSILSEQKNNMTQNSKLQILGRMVELVSEMRNVLYSGKITKIGSVLHENWLLKKQLASKISTPDIDDIYNLGLKNGASGGKLLGAGGGGFMLFFCPGEKQRKKLRSALHKLRELDFNFETEGSKIIYIGDEYA